MNDVIRTSKTRAECSHEKLRFGSGDYYIFCANLDCGAKWAAIGGSQPEYGVDAAGRTVGCNAFVSNQGIGGTLSGHERYAHETPEQLRVRLAKDIYDDGQDHHPPGYVGRKGDMVVIHSIQTAVVSHRGTGDGFVVHDGELALSSSEKAKVVLPPCAHGATSEEVCPECMGLPSDNPDEEIS